jgi:hypothetical protein
MMRVVLANDYGRCAFYPDCDLSKEIVKKLGIRSFNQKMVDAFIEADGGIEIIQVTSKVPDKYKPYLQKRV